MTRRFAAALNLFLKSKISKDMKENAQSRFYLSVSLV
jgi:hypothetical protein